jgi:transposase-like protein
MFLADGAESLHDACRRQGLDFRYERHGNRNSVKYKFCEINSRTTSSKLFQ